jgi:murein DD-endopeptidase MepM/ murein hydrolase activator NlpD
MDGVFDLELARHLVKSVDLGLARQLTRQMESRSSGGLGMPAAGQASASTSAAPAGGALASPLAAPVSSAYGERRDPISGEPDFHAGLDLAAPRGTPVRAAAAGTVRFGGVRGSAGNLVEVEHDDGTRTSYAHLESIDVAPGERVAVGQVLGAVGSTGRTTGPHLHFAVQRAGVAIDPAPLLDRVAG